MQIDVHRIALIRHLLFGCCLALALPLSFAANKPLDAVIVMDSSGSMAINDPDRMRVPAAKLFSSLLGEQDRLGVVSFSDKGYPVVYLTPLTSSRKRTQVMSAIDKVSSKGVYTNLDDALQKAIGMFAQTSNDERRKVIVLLTDGKMDVGNVQEDQVLIKKIKSDTLTTLRQQKIRVYTLAFTQNSDLALLELIGRQTNARFTVADTTNELHRIFTEIFEASKEPNMLPMPGGYFTADESLNEVTLVATKDSVDSRITLIAPDGMEYEHQHSADNMKWSVNRYFDVVTISNPQAGRWRLLSSEDTSKAYVVTVMELASDLADRELHVGSNLIFHAWLTRSDQLITEEKLLEVTQFTVKIKTPDAEEVTIELQSDAETTAATGQFRGAYHFQQLGKYDIQLTAKSSTFERQRRFQINILPATESISEPYEAIEAPEPIIQPVPLTDEKPTPPLENSETPDQEKKVPSHSREKPNTPKPAVDQSDPPLDIKPVMIEDDSDSQVSARDIGLDQQGESSSGVVILIIFVTVNLLLAGSVAAVIWISRRSGRNVPQEPDADA